MWPTIRAGHHAHKTGGYRIGGACCDPPFDQIKIDRGFISDVDDDSEAETIVQAIVAMSRGLRLDVTADGAETRQQLAMPRALGCNFIQDYPAARPRGAAQLELQTTKPRWQIIDHAGARLVATSAARSA